MTDMAAESSAPAELPKPKTDWLPLALVPALARKRAGDSASA